MRVIVCGSRDLYDKKVVWGKLDELHQEREFTTLIHGAARGADTLAGEWAKEQGLIVEEYPAQWTKYGKKAGPIRNELMLRTSFPDLVVAFPRKTERDKRKLRLSGTEHMMTIAKNAGVEVLEFLQEWR